MKPVFELTVRGIPAPQGSKRHVGNGVMIESSKKVKPWREAVCNAAVDARAGAPALDCPLLVDMVFTFVRPKSHYRTGRNNWLLRDGMPPQPATAPDLSKLARSTEDALQTAGVLRDDARIAEYGRLAKVWAGTGPDPDPDALDSPGVGIVELAHVERLEVAPDEDKEPSVTVGLKLRHAAGRSPSARTSRTAMNHQAEVLRRLEVGTFELHDMRKQAGKLYRIVTAALEFREDEDGEDGD